MNLNNFEDFVSETILERGRKYYKQGKVAELCDDDGVFSALVDGSQCYDVTIQIDGSGNIVEHNCSCPYFLDNICKHKVAVLFTIRDGECQSADNSKKAVTRSKKKSPKTSPLNDIVSKMSREELEAVVLKQAQNDKAFEVELIRAHSPVTGDLKEARKLIMSFIRKHKRQGFIEYGRVNEALTGADMVISDAQSLYDAGEHLKALNLFLLTNAIVTDVASCSDDDGDISPRLDECMSYIGEIVSDLADSGDKKLCTTCFDMIVVESLNPVYWGWHEGLDLLACCVSFCSDKTIADELWQILDEFLENKKDDLSNYQKSTVNRIKHSILSLNDEAAAEKFEEANITDNHFRQLLIERNIKQKHYEKALSLCDEQSLSLFSNYDYKLLIYKTTGQIDKYRQTLLEAACKYDIDPYFSDLKATYNDSEWMTLLPSILDEIEKANRYIGHSYWKILIEYRFFDRLLNCVRKQPSLIVDYYRELLPDYAAEVQAIFEQHLTKKFDSANKRNQYIDCCRHLRVYKKACGNELMLALKKKMLALYPKKTALVEELKKLD